jgi:hypothetical protein
VLFIHSSLGKTVSERVTVVTEMKQGVSYLGKTVSERMKERDS